VIFEALPDDLPGDLREELASRLRTCRQAIESDIAAAMRDSLAPPLQFVGASNEQSPAVIAVRSTLSALLSAISRPVTSPDKTEAHHPLRRLFVADAFSNPANWQFALKTTIAVMISYAIYTLLDWPGMRTAIVTCFFVALSSLGETVHKLLLRLSGAVIGGLISGLCIVFVLPHLTDIGQLCLLIFAVSLGAAWVATSSELLSYAGMQIAFAFFLGILQGYAPATDLTVLRDRVAGILLGNIVITIVFSSFWPQSARSGVRAALAEALRAIGEVIRQPRSAEETRMRTVQALVRADHLHTLSLFELRMLPSHARESLSVPSVANIKRLAGAAFVVSTDAISPNAELGSTARLAEWAQSAADNLSGGRPLPPSPVLTTSSPATAIEPGARLSLHAIEQLESEVQHVASAVH
jgi:multidrug resistance protein MdtO